jgi:hypothetical protein
MNLVLSWAAHRMDFNCNECVAAAIMGVFRAPSGLRLHLSIQLQCTLADSGVSLKQAVENHSPMTGIVQKRGLL